MKQDRQKQQIEGGPKERTTERRAKVVETPSDPVDFYPKRNDEDMLSEAIKRVESKRSRQIPAAVQNLEVIVEQRTIANRDLAVLTVTFTQPSDPNFAGARVWIKGYGTNNVLGDPDTTLGQAETLPFEVKAQITRSPASILLENSQEEIVVGVESFNSEGIGAGVTNMPTQTLLLDFNGQ